MKKSIPFIIAVLSLTLIVTEGHAQEVSDNEFAHIQSGGTYTMLADIDNHVGDGEEVAISKDYYIARYAVTNQQWQSFISARSITPPKHWAGGAIPEGKERHPVVWVSADEALSYCQWLEEQYPDYTFRLPTQGEWEYAASGDLRTLYPWGNQADASYTDSVLHTKFNYNAVVGAYILQTPDRMATYNNVNSSRYGEQERVGDIFSISGSGSVSGWINHSDYTGFVYTDVFTQINDTGGYTCAVDDYPEGASPWGCYNMSGNCWEWTSTVETATNGAEQGQQVNMIKGGSWYATMTSCRVSYRGEGRKGSGRYATVGFRVVAEKKSSTGIDTVSDNERPVVYSLEGYRLNAPRKGVNIIGHKLVKH